MIELVGAPFEVGQPIMLGMGPADARRWHRTTVRRVDARVVWLDGASSDQANIDVQPGEDVAVQTWRHMDALYQVQAQVAFARLAPEPLIGLTVRDAARIQQREYVRVPLTTEAWGLYLGPESRSAELPAQPVRLEVRDLSAGGLRGRSSLTVSPGDELEIDLPLPRAERTAPAAIQTLGQMTTLPDLSEPLSLRARVVRLIETLEDLPPEMLACEIGVAFLEVPREAHERIIRFALGVQRDRRRRGML